jgi:hypothetical protein
VPGEDASEDRLGAPDEPDADEVDAVGSDAWNDGGVVACARNADDRLWNDDSGPRPATVHHQSYHILIAQFTILITIHKTIEAREIYPVTVFILIRTCPYIFRSP